jgi:hypothetical protein
MLAPVHQIARAAMLLVLCGALAGACSKASPIGPAVPLNQQFVLAPGQQASIEGTTTRVQFVEVLNDSRCPLNALCITAGDALIAISIIDDQGSSRYEVRTNDPVRRKVTHREFLVECVALQPYPDTNRPTDPANYRAVLDVTRK